MPGRVTGYSFNGNVTVALTQGFDSAGRVNSVRGDYSTSNTTFTLGYAAGTHWVNAVTNGSYARLLPLVSRYDVLESASTTWGTAERARFVAGRKKGSNPIV